MNQAIIAIIAGILLAASPLMGQSVPHTFSANTPAKAGEVNENFEHLANQFYQNKKTINCPGDNLTQALSEGYNHLTINGACTLSLAVTSGNRNIDTFNRVYSSFLPGPIPDIPVHPRVILVGGTGKDTDSITASGDLISAETGGDIFIDGLTLNGNIQARFNSVITIYESKVIGSFKLEYNANAYFVFSELNIPTNEELEVSGNSSLKADNLTITGDVNVRFGSYFETNLDSEISGLTYVRYNSMASINETEFLSSGTAIAGEVNSYIDLNDVNFSGSGSVSCDSSTILNHSSSNHSSTNC